MVVQFVFQVRGEGRMTWLFSGRDWDGDDLQAVSWLGIVHAGWRKVEFYRYVR